LLKSECHLSESCILDFFQNFGIEVSSAYISNQWTKGYDDFHQEKAAIFEAGLSSTSYQQIDDTSARVKGQNHYTQIVCNSFYSAYFTTERKDRLTVLDVFRDFAPRQFLYNAEAISLLDSFKLAKKIRRVVDAQLEINKIYDENEFNSLLNTIKPGSQQRTRIMEACAIAAYREQKEKPLIKILMCDDAPQFNLLTEELTLCWIHDGRHYKKLNPVVSQHKTLSYKLLISRHIFLGQLSLSNHMCCFNSCNRCLSGVKRFKSHHWFGYFFDKSMVLFDNIIQIFNLAYLDHSGKSSQD
jgi:hypothetical protein